MLPGLIVVVLLSGAAAPAGSQQSPQAFVDQAEAEFAAGRIDASIETLDRLAKLVPSIGPALWQRGVALYVAGRFSDCVAQFAAFHADDPKDLENAAWHFFCVARAQSFDRARELLLEAGPDQRVLRQQICEMCEGRRTPENLLALAGASVDIVQFYANLYAGLYMDASGNRAGAIEHLETAASDRFKEYGGFMNVVARVYVDRLKRAP
jgi:lipoprotein NlpI